MKIAGIMGWPIGHSKSPKLHGFWLNQFSINGAYVPFAVDPKNLEHALSALPILGIKGVNLTIPHKELAIDIVDELDETAKMIGAANTIVVQSDGSLCGSNTDAFGFIEHLKQNQPQWQGKGRTALIIGAGGAARAVIFALLQEGVKHIFVANRTLSRARDLCQYFGDKCQAIALSEAGDIMPNTDLLVNSSSLGMSGQEALDLPFEHLTSRTTVYDIVYTPLETELLRQAAQRDCPCVDGLGMLLHQAVPGFKAWFGQKPNVTADLRAHLLNDR